MSWLKSLSALLDEDSDKSVEKVLDKVENRIGNATDKLEIGLKKIDNAGQEVVKYNDRAEAALNKLSKISNES